MLYSPVHITLSIAHFDFISDYTMMLDSCQREWHNPQSSHNTAQDNMNIGVSITRGKVSFCLLSFRGQKPILCMIYLRKFSKLLFQENLKKVITHVLIEKPLKKKSFFDSKRFLSSSILLILISDSPLDMALLSNSAS